MGKETKIGPKISLDWSAINVPIDGITKGLATLQGYASNVKKIAQETFEIIKDTVDATQFSPLISKVNSIGREVEKVFNAVNSIPGICFLGGRLRQLFGLIQVITGIFILAIGEIGKMVYSDEAKLSKKWHSLSYLGLEHTLHGCLNIMRGFAETNLASYTMSLGNLFLIIPNLKKDFGPYIFDYGVLVNPTIVEDTPKAAVPPDDGLPSLPIEEPFSLLPGDFKTDLNAGG